MGDLIDISCNDWTIMGIYKDDVFGGKKFNLMFTDDMKEMFAWYKQYKEQMLKESKAREQFESVAAAYEQYQMTLKLVLDQI